MTVLHLGHQVTDVTGLNSSDYTTDTNYFDSDLDTNGISVMTDRDSEKPFDVNFKQASGDTWLGFRFRSATAYMGNILRSDAEFLIFYDSNKNIVARIRPNDTTENYHAVAHGDTVVEDGSTFTWANSTTYWVDVRVRVTSSQVITSFYVDGTLQSEATASNSGAVGKPVMVKFPTKKLTSTTADRSVGYAHITVLDGISTIGRRFARKTANTIGNYNQMSGLLASLSDGDITTFIESNLAGQKTSFSVTGPAGKASPIAGVHTKLIAKAGINDPILCSSFLRVSATDFDGDLAAPDVDTHTEVYSTWVTNPNTGVAWTPTEINALEMGIVSRDFGYSPPP